MPKDQPVTYTLSPALLVARAGLPHLPGRAQLLDAPLREGPAGFPSTECAAAWHSEEAQFYGAMGR